MATNPLDQNERNLAGSTPGEMNAQIGPGVSPEARAILEAALSKRPKRSLFEVLASMPNVGEDSDFERHPR